MFTCDSCVLVIAGFCYDLVTSSMYNSLSTVTVSDCRQSHGDVHLVHSLYYETWSCIKLYGRN